MLQRAKNMPEIVTKLTPEQRKTWIAIGINPHSRPDGIWSALMFAGPLSTVSPFSLLCETVFPLINGKELSFDKMTHFEKFTCMHSLMEMLDTYTAIIENYNIKAVPFSFRNFAKFYQESFKSIPDEVFKNTWEKKVAEDKLYGILPGFSLMTAIHQSGKRDVETIEAMSATYRRFCYLYWHSAACDIGIEKSLSDIFSMLEDMKRTISRFKKLPNTWPALQAHLKSNRLTLSPKVFWTLVEEKKDKGDHFNLIAPGGGVEGSPVSRPKTPPAIATSLYLEAAMGGVGAMPVPEIPKTAFLARAPHQAAEVKVYELSDDTLVPMR